MPSNFDEVLSIYTERGFRVLALGTKVLDINYMQSQKMLRDEVEGDLEFLGLLIMQNKLKAVTTQTIETLKMAKVRTIMATGDNILTAISVGRECNIIDGESEVFLADVKREGDKDVIFWKSTKGTNH
jgi:cation-transporting ATPase 13A3/4/5